MGGISNPERRLRRFAEAPIEVAFKRLAPVSPWEVVLRFEKRFGVEPRLFRAPGRVNIIGDHTDYSGGLAMPAAIDRATLAAATLNESRRLNVVGGSIGQQVSLDLGCLTPRHDWSDYVAGVAWVMQLEGVELSGADLWIESDVPIGAGLSSSAALEVSAATALLSLSGTSLDGATIALWCQRAENEFVGVPCGILDQYASTNAEDGAALLLDCRSVASEPVPFPERGRFLVVDSMVTHAHVSGEYRRRREECETAAARLEAPMLRDVEVSDLPGALARLPEPLARRCRHVVTENARVVSAVQALRRGDLAELGRLMNQSHASLRDDFDVSTREVEELVTIAREAPGVFGARIMGGGFGGSIVALASADGAEQAVSTIQLAYGRKRGRSPDAFVCRAAAGATEVKL
ncbi:MAG: galactokinase [Caulobacteraceae bacterium]